MGTSDKFRFDLKAKRPRVSDEELLNALQVAAEIFGECYFPSTQFDKLPDKQVHSSTIIERFGSWKKALALIGIKGGRERRYSPEELIDNLEKVWRELGYPPGKRKIKTMGDRISETPYKHHWGSVHAACKSLSDFHEGHISREELLAGKVDNLVRTTIPLRDRWTVLKRDNYRCSKCGASPSSDHTVELEVDHIIPVVRGGSNCLENLQTLCKKCNQGKKDR